MNTLINKTNNNLNIFLNLKEDNTINSSNYTLNIKDEYVQVDNYLEIEYATYYTFTSLFLKLNDSSYIECDVILNQIDKAIDNIYNNNQLNNLINTQESFKNIIDYIDNQFRIIKENLFHESPFFSSIVNISKFYYKIINIFEENNVYINKMLGVYKKKQQDRTLKREYLEKHGYEENYSENESIGSDSGSDSEFKEIQ